VRRCSVALVVVPFLAALAACGGSSDGGSSSATDASDGTEAPTGTTGGSGDDATAAVQAEVDRVMALPAKERDEAVASALLELSLAISEISGLTEAVGGVDAARDALTASAEPIIQQATALSTVQLPQGFRAASPAPPAPTVGEGLFGGYMVVALGAEGSVTASNDIVDSADGKPAVATPAEGVTVTAVRTSAELSTTVTSTDQKSGVTTKLTTKSVVTPCPDANGSFEASAIIDVSATKGSVGQTGTLEVKVVGQVDDDAVLASSESSYRMQFAKFGSGPGGYIDLSYGPAGFAVNRTGGTVTQEIIDTATSSGALLAAALHQFLTDAARKGWESGRCVRLDATPSAGPKGLAPSTVLSITAAPRSRIDGGPTGGNVVATLSAGGQAVEPDGSPVPADASFNYTAPGEPNKSGTVSMTAKSRRGIGKAEITFETSAPAAYTIVGGLDDFQVNQAVCDIMAPFTLSGGGVVANYTGGLSGTYSYTGPFNGSGEGTYTISLPNGLGQPGTMQGEGSGQVVTPLGVFSNTGTENFTLTPLTDCVD
jgi:hypothetical protein